MIRGGGLKLGINFKCSRTCTYGLPCLTMFLDKLALRELAVLILIIAVLSLVFYVLTPRYFLC
ncbi:transmembrane protein, putative [Medicago truncatula]|uniref:Transmembrane protein, putative n=1 Tax=Medicago truncatula TaxID=3880 RepID=G7IZD8_MEDTR|nr:transmembrane protein, putative [Medicago truncatula]